jgi:hypothetical protein
MALIGYPYSAASQDLWLYAPETIVHSGGSTVVESPVAWNPGSPLYGYRRSLQGISLRKRYASNINLNASYFQYNDPNDPANKWVYNNCYPMAFLAITRKHLFTCAHCYGRTVSAVRNPAQKWSGTVWTPNTLNDKLTAFKWMDSDNNISDSFETTQVIAPYGVDTTPPLTTDADVLLSELEGTLSFEPLQVVDFLNLAPNATMWLVDSTMKIIRMKTVSSSVGYSSVSGTSQERLTVQSMLPDGSATAIVQFFLHDSGSFLLAEIRPPSSPAAGDGIMGLVASHVYTGGSFYSPAGFYGELSAPGQWGSAPNPINIRQYTEDTGFEMKPLIHAKRQHTDLVLVNEMDRLLERVQAIQLPE